MPVQRKSMCEGIFAEVCERLGSGENLVAIFEDEDKPSVQAWLKWLRHHPDRKAELNEALTGWALINAMEADRLAEKAKMSRKTKTITTPKGEITVEVVEHDAVDRCRLAADVKLKLAAKLDPKRFGDRTAIEASGPDGAPLKVEVVFTKPLTDDQLGLPEWKGRGGR